MGLFGSKKADEQTSKAFLKLANLAHAHIAGSRTGDGFAWKGASINPQKSSERDALWNYIEFYCKDLPSSDLEEGRTQWVAFMNHLVEESNRERSEEEQPFCVASTQILIGLVKVNSACQVGLKFPKDERIQHVLRDLTGETLEALEALDDRSAPIMEPLLADMLKRFPALWEWLGGNKIEKVLERRWGD